MLILMTVDPGSYELIDVFLEYRELAAQNEDVVEGGYIVNPQRRDGFLAGSFAGTGPPMEQQIACLFPVGERPRFLVYQWSVVYRLRGGSDIADIASAIFLTGFEWIDNRPLGQFGGDAAAPGQ